MSVVSIIDKGDIEVPIIEKFVVETLAIVMMNFDGEYIKYYDETFNELAG